MGSPFQDGAFYCPYGAIQIDPEKREPICMKESKYGLDQPEKFKVNVEDDDNYLVYEHHCGEKVIVGLNEKTAYCASLSSEFSLDAPG